MDEADRPSVEELLSLGDMGLDLGYWAQAEAYFDRVLESDPHHPEALLGKARACRDPHQALEIVRKLLAVMPNAKPALQLEHELQERVTPETQVSTPSPAGIDRPAEPGPADALTLVDERALRREDMAPPRSAAGQKPHAPSFPRTAIFLLVIAFFLLLGLFMLPRLLTDDDPLIALSESEAEFDDMQPTDSASLAETGLSSDLLAQAPRSTVLVLVTDASRTAVQQGSGVVIDPMGLILTNYHVLADQDKTLLNADGLAFVGFASDVREPPDEWYIAAAVALDASRDLAVLRIVYTLEGWSVRGGSFIPLSLRDVSDLTLGESVVGLGYPDLGGNTVTLTRGSMAGFTVGLDDVRMGKTDSQLLPGSSGGAVLDAQGRLVGIITGVHVDQRTQGRLSYFVLIDQAEEIMAQARREPRPSPSMLWMKDILD